MAVEAKLKIVKHKLYTLYNEYVKLYSKKQTTCNVASSQCSSQGTSSVSTFASGKSSTSQWLIVNEKVKVWRLGKIMKLHQTWSQML
ncbi:hypothetical protein glysoja_023667 [Glycine soja]|nr:hypothetical protein JHK87_055053 [Glycine soja]KHN08057.1 hypothetical protein glysoja_023667 [Glycine soja]